MASIELRNLSKTYENGHQAVKGIDLSIDKGEFTVLVGPSGCGKSSLLRMIAGLETISDGELLFDGQLVNETAPKDRNIGMVFQNYALYPHMSLRENIAFPLKIAKWPKDKIRQAVEETAQMVDISKLLDRKPKEISGGQRQRAALARAIVRKPSIFLFDEPLSNLDALLRVSMRLEIAKLHKSVGATSVYVTHDQVEAITLGEKIVVMNEGEIMQVGTPAEIYSDPRNLFVAGFIGQPSINRIKGSISEGFFRSEGGTLELECSCPNSPEATLAIRAEHLEIADGETKADITVSPFGHEDHGHEEILFFELEGCTWAYRSKERQSGSKLSIRLPREKCLFFDGEGQRIGS